MNNEFKENLQKFLVVKGATGYNFESQQTIKNNLKKIKSRESLLKVYADANLSFDYMDNTELIDIWDKLLE